MAPDINYSSCPYCSLDESSSFLPSELSIMSQNDITPSSTSESFHSPQSSTLEPFPTVLIPPQESRREQRQRNKHVLLKNFVSDCTIDQLPIPTASHIYNGSSSAQYLILTYPYTNSTIFDHAYTVFLGNVSTIKEPTTYALAST